jgi:hypothetical protein
MTRRERLTDPRRIVCKWSSSTTIVVWPLVADDADKAL